MGPTLPGVKGPTQTKLCGMPGRGYPKVTVRLHPALMAKLTQAADAAGMDRAALVRELIRRYLAELPERPARDAE